MKAASFRTGALPVIALLAYALWIVTYPVFDYDLYWHLANGREALARGEPVQSELFSYTHRDEPFPHLYHAWLAQPLFYLLWQAGGGHALLALKLAITTIVALLVYRAARDWQAPPAMAAMLCGWAVLVGWFRFVERPELFSLLGMAILGAVLAGHLSGKRRSLWLAALPPLFVAWDCLHGAVYGMAALLIVATAENIKPRLPARGIPGWAPLPPERLRAFNLACAATLVVALLNPYGLTSYLGFFDIVTGRAAFNAGYANVTEFQPPTWVDYKPFFALVAAGVLVFALAGRAANPTHALVFLAFAVLAVRVSRVTGVFALISAPLVAATAHVVWQRVGAALPHRRRIAWTISALLAVALLGYGVKVKHFEPESPQAFGLHVDDRFLPAGSVRFIMDQSITGNIYNTGHFGGYLAFHLSPERPIFQYNLPMIFGDTYRYPAHPDELARWNIDYAVLGDPLETALLFPRSAWARVYREAAAVLVVRRDARNAALIERYELQHFHPMMDDAGFHRTLANPSAAPRLLLEVGDYLGYRQDERWAELLRLALAARPELAADIALAPVLARADARQRQPANTP